MILFFLCGAALLYHEGDYLLSLRRASVMISPQEAPLVRALPDWEQSDGGKMDINLASAKDLEAVPGIGPATAEKILALREERGGFFFIEELLDVSGVGEKRLTAIKEMFYCPASAVP